jgi:transcriptional regulator with XRE-family HTH domain
VAVKKRASFLVQVGDRIRKERLKLGISQSQLAYEIKTSLRQIQRIENGEVNTGIISLYKIAEALEVDIKKLIP